MLSGAALIDDIERCRVDTGECALWWLGQQSFVIKFGRIVCYCDLFLSPDARRQIPPLLRPDEIHNADFIFGSHDHSDHIDRKIWPTLAKSSPQARFVVPELLKEKLSAQLGIDPARLIGLDNNKTVAEKGLTITGIAAAHEFLDRDPQTGQYPHLGYIIEANSCRVYHAGDTCNYEGLQTRLKELAPDIMLLPINGRDAKRFASGCIGNMTYQESADLAGSVAPLLTIPAHYDMFLHNSEDPSLFISYINAKYPALNAQICRHSERLIVDCNTRKH